MTHSPQTRPGDVIVIVGHHVGDSHRMGEILEVLAVGDRPRYRVRWDDDRETIVYPGADVVIRHRRAEPAAR